MGFALHRVLGIAVVSFLLSSSPLSPLFAADCYETHCRSESDSLGRKPIDNLLDSLQFKDPRVTEKSASSFLNCTQNETEALKKGEQQAFELIADWAARLKEHYKYHQLKALIQSRPSDERGFPEPVEWQATETLECVDRILNGGVQYKCNASEIGAAWAWAFPLLGRTIKVSKHFFNESADHISGMIIHETTHKCGLTDATYFNYKYDSPKSTTLVHWSAIADTYEYWAEFGFCFPEETCPH